MEHACPATPKAVTDIFLQLQERLAALGCRDSYDAALRAAGWEALNRLPAVLVGTRLSSRTRHVKVGMERVPHALDATGPKDSCDKPTAGVISRGSCWPGGALSVAPSAYRSTTTSVSLITAPSGPACGATHIDPALAVGPCGRPLNVSGSCHDPWLQLGDQDGGSR